MRLACLVVALLLTGCGVTRPPADAGGADIYAQLCANCHGTDLEGGSLGPPLGEGSQAASLPAEFMETTIVHGRGRMPSFSSSLDDAQVERLVAYLLEEQGR